MKKNILIIGIFILSLTLFAQEITHETLVINIEVPVRVFKGGKFVNDLTINDFEVFEDGKLQKLEAVYLIKKRSIERKEERKKFTPQTSRNFYLIFEVTEYYPKIREAVDYFVQNVLVPGDNLTVVTPMTTYKMKSQTFEILSKEQVVEQLNGLLRKDIVVGNSEYRNAVKDVTALARELSGSDSQDEFTTAGGLRELEFDQKLTLYADFLKKLEHMRKVDQQKLLEFSNFLKDMEGQKYVFLFYQREYIPQIKQSILDRYMSEHQDRQDILFTLMELFDLYRREISFDVDRVKQAYADSSIAIHFLFFTKPRRHIPGINLVEHSEDIFAAFREMAEATGGLAESSAEPVALFQKAVEASENYYLIYYSPINYKKDGKFKKIEVLVKDKNYRILHRAGYFAN